MIHKALFEFPFRTRFSGAEKVEEVGILKRLRREVRVHRWQGSVEVHDSTPLPFVCLALDLESEHVSAPARFARSRRGPGLSRRSDA